MSKVAPEPYGSMQIIIMQELVHIVIIQETAVVDLKWGKGLNFLPCLEVYSHAYLYGLTVQLSDSAVHILEKMLL